MSGVLKSMHQQETLDVTRQGWNAVSACNQATTPGEEAIGRQ
jgi:hypothetical protein